MNVNGASRNISTQKPLETGGTQISKNTDGSYTLNLSDKDNKVEISQNKDKSWSINIDGKTKLKLSDAEMANLTINGNGGNDTITVKNGDLKSTLNIDGGKGSDTVKLGFDPQKGIIVDRDKVNYDKGAYQRGDRDTFEYGSKKPNVTGGAGQALTRSYTATKEVAE